MEWSQPFFVVQSVLSEKLSISEQAKNIEILFYGWSDFESCNTTQDPNHSSRMAYLACSCTLHSWPCWHKFSGASFVPFLVSLADQSFRLRTKHPVITFPKYWRVVGAIWRAQFIPFSLRSPSLPWQLVVMKLVSGNAPSDTSFFELTLLRANLGWKIAIPTVIFSLYWIRDWFCNPGNGPLGYYADLFIPR